MKITKKTMLLAKPLKRVTIDTASIDKEGRIVLVGENLDGTKRYEDDGTIAMVHPLVTKAGSGETEDLTLGRRTTEDPHRYTGSLIATEVAPGDELTLAFEVDPAKPDFEPGIVSKTVIVSAD